MTDFEIYNADGRIGAVEEPTAVTVGVFDGVHRGHQALFSQLSTLHPALATLAVTLTAHPSYVLGRHESEYWLDDPQEHLRLLFEAGVKYAAVLPFTPEVARLSACQMARLMHERLQMRALLLGYDSRFGCRTSDTSRVSSDDFDRLPMLGEELGFTVGHGRPFTLGDKPISSSRIRESLVQGRVDETARLLGRPYALSGSVTHGRGVGRTLGFPTANVSLKDTRKMLPQDGVYAVTLSSFKGIANLGPMPTFGIDEPSLEVHLLDFGGDLYGQQVEVQFVRRLRGIERFKSPEALQRQLQEDLNACRKI